MSDQSKSSRSMQDIQKQYQELCFKSGHLQYQVYTFKKELDLVNSELRDLNLEAAAVKAKEESEKQEQEGNK